MLTWIAVGVLSALWLAGIRGLIQDWRDPVQARHTQRKGPPPAWLFGREAWRAFYRSITPGYVSVTCLLIGGSLRFPPSPAESGRRLALSMAFGLLFFAWDFLALSVLFFNRPIGLIPPGLRRQRSLLLSRIGKDPRGSRAL